MDVNTGGVCGTITTGGGHGQLEEFLSVLDIPSMSQRTFKKYEKTVSAGWSATAAAEMAELQRRHDWHEKTARWTKTAHRLSPWLLTARGANDPTALITRLCPALQQLLDTERER